jgi:elongation factor 1-gamma
MKLHGQASSPDTWKILVAAKYAGVNIDFHATETVSTDLSPLGKPPVLETQQGALFETNAIARYVSRVGKKLYGGDDHQAGLVDQWIEFAASEIDLPAAVWTYPLLGLIENNPAAVAQARTDLRKALDVLNKHLATQTFLAGERLTLADVVVSLSLVHAFELAVDASQRKSLVNVTRWFMTCVNQPEFAGVIGRAVTLCEKAQQPKEVEKKPAAEKKAKEQPAKPKEQPKEQAKPKKKEQEEDDGEEEESFEEKPKAKNPLDLLPPSKLNLDEWKRTYSNADNTRGEAVPWFWEHYDKEGWSLWLGDYKYNAELSKVFMTCNFVNGYIQRLDRLRKYGFSSFVIFGDEGSLAIGCVFLVRGHALPPEMTEAEDTELYAWRRLDEANPQDKAIVEDYWCWDGKFDRSMPFNQGKIFK